MLLGAVTALVWIAHFDRWTPASWFVPTAYSGDAYETLARLQAAAEGDTGLLRSQVITRLGAPFGAHWNAYPMPDKPLMSALGALSRDLGLYFTANLALVLAQVSAAVSFYLVARRLRCRWEWACAGALLFSYTYHTFHRGLPHFSLLFTWTVPLGLLAVWLVARSTRLAWQNAGAAVCIGAAIALGVSNPYNLYFWLQLMGWAVIAQVFGRGRRSNAIIGVVSIVLACSVFAIANAERWLYADDTEARPLLERNYSGTERYALKPVELLLPPPSHPWDFFAAAGRHYTAWSNWRGEGVTSYLGLAGIAGLGWLALEAIRRALAGKSLPPQALSVAWLIAFSTIGGITNLVALFAPSLQIFRATNRVAIFLSAIFVLWLVTRLSRLTRGWPPWWRAAAALGVGAIGVREQLPRPAPEQIETAAARVQSDQDFGRQLEAALGPRAMVFQLPYLDFPEVTPPYRLSDYEHFRPYLATRTLRFSYGSPRARARGCWQRDVQNGSPAALVRALEASGFAALYLNRKGFEDDGAHLVQALRHLGCTRSIESADHEQVAVLLHPGPLPLPPLGRELTIGRGWKIRPTDGAPWAYDVGALSYHNPHPYPLTVDLRMTLVSGVTRRLALELEGRTVREFMVPGDTTHVTFPRVTLRPGINRFRVRSHETPAERAPGSNEARAFGLKEATVIPTIVVGRRS
jgi:phosphoglycerol transferase